MPGTRVAVVDDHQLVRIGLKQIIESQPDFTWAGEAKTGREALTLLRNATCDVLLLDLSLPDMSGLDVLRQIKAHHESVATLVLSAYPENQYGLNVLRAGASGFVSKTADDGELCRAIRAAVRGGRYVSPELAEMLVSGMQGGMPGEPRHAVLSEREFQIFCKLAEGRSVSEIAAKLFLSVKTVSTYRTRILEKMGMKTNADITYYAIKNNLLQ
ncbi:MAG TPA: response regulator transcription factor [Steroidobacteraceae bacterium]|nr:response regulator transcription factor [Steroidobacteraceae bacterium]